MSNTDHTPESGSSLRRKVTRRRLLASAGLVAGVGLLAACTGQQPAASPAPTQPPAAPTQPAPAAPAATAPAAAPSPAAAASPAAQAPAEGRRGGKVTWAIEQDPVHLIPFGAIPTANQWGKEFIYDSLLEWDRDLQVQHALATSWEAPDPLTYIFKLREGVRFHNGDEVTSADVKYSFEMQAAPPPPGTTIQFYPKVDTLETPDKYTFKVNLKQPDPTIIGYLAWSRYSPVVPNGLYDKINVLTEAIGTGPFKLVEYISNDRVIYTRNPDFWKPGLPYLDDLELKVMLDEQARVAALRSAAIDGATVGPDSARTLQNDQNLTVLKGLFAAHREIQFNLLDTSKPWSNKQVRQAINHAINRDEIIDKVFGGDAEYSGEIPPGYGDWPLSQDELRGKFLRYDVDHARALMRDAGLANGFKVVMNTIANPISYVQISEIVKEHLKAINVDVEVQPQEIGTFAKHNGDGTFEWHLTGRGMRGDASNYVAEFHPSAAIHGRWFGQGWQNTELNSLIENGLAETDLPKRLQIYRRAQEILMDELPHVTLVQPYKYQVVRNRVKNMYVAYTDFNTGLKEVWVEG